MTNNVHMIHIRPQRYLQKPKGNIPLKFKAAVLNATARSKGVTLHTNLPNPDDSHLSSAGIIAFPTNIPHCEVKSTAPTADTTAYENLLRHLMDVFSDTTGRNRTVASVDLYKAIALKNGGIYVEPSVLKNGEYDSLIQTIKNVKPIKPIPLQQHLKPKNKKGGRRNIKWSHQAIAQENAEIDKINGKIEIRNEEISQINKELPEKKQKIIQLYNILKIAQQDHDPDSQPKKFLLDNVKKYTMLADSFLKEGNKTIKEILQAFNINPEYYNKLEKREINLEDQTPKKFIAFPLYFYQELKHLKNLFEMLPDSKIKSFDDSDFKIETEKTLGQDTPLNKIGNRVILSNNQAPILDATGKKMLQNPYFSASFAAVNGQWGGNKLVEYTAGTESLFFQRAEQKSFQSIVTNIITNTIIKLSNMWTGQKRQVMPQEAFYSHKDVAQEVYKMNGKEGTTHQKTCDMIKNTLTGADNSFLQKNRIITDSETIKNMTTHISGQIFSIHAIGNLYEGIKKDSPEYHAQMQVNAKLSSFFYPDKKTPLKIVSKAKWSPEKPSLHAQDTLSLKSSI